MSPTDSPATSRIGSRGGAAGTAACGAAAAAPAGAAALSGGAAASSWATITSRAAGPSMYSTICSSPPTVGISVPTSRPSRRTVARSHTAMTSASRWVMNSTERPCSFHSRMTPNTRSARSEGRAAVISSRSRSCGSRESARARSSMRSVARGRSPTSSPMSMGSSSMRSSQLRTRPTSAPVRRRLWATVRSGTSAGSWNTGARPSRRAARGDETRTSRSPMRMRAGVGPDDAGQELDERALAGPVGSEQGVDLTRLDDQVGGTQGHHGAVALGQSLRRQKTHLSACGEKRVARARAAVDAPTAARGTCRFAVRPRAPCSS